SPEDILIRVTVENRGPEAATLHVLPTLWFRNTWSWGGDEPQPGLRQASPGVISAAHTELGPRRFACDRAPALLFTEHSTDTTPQRLLQTPNRTPFVKDGIDSCIVHGRRDAVNTQQEGTKAAAHYPVTVPAGGSATIRMRLQEVGSDATFGKAFDAIVDARR